MPQTVAVIGVGLMGASICHAIKQYKLDYRIIGVGRSEEKLKQIHAHNLCDITCTQLTDPIIGLANIVFVCTPIQHIIPTIEKIIPTLCATKKHIIVSDIGSVKSKIVKSYQSLVEKYPAMQKFISFVPTHPMVGSEKSGFKNMIPDLYRGENIVITSQPNSATEIIQNFWYSIKSKVIFLDPVDHDDMVAYSSHLLHILSSFLSQFIANKQRFQPVLKQLLAGSFASLTRVSGSDPEQWANITLNNKVFLVQALRSYLNELSFFLENFEDSREDLTMLKKFFSTAKEERMFLLNKDNVPSSIS